MKAASSEIGIRPQVAWTIRENDMCAYLEIREALELKALDLTRHDLELRQLEEMLAGNQVTEGGETPR